MNKQTNPPFIRRLMNISPHAVGVILELCAVFALPSYGSTVLNDLLSQ
jgi:hypothetical protein